MTFTNSSHPGPVEVSEERNPGRVNTKLGGADAVEQRVRLLVR